MHRPTLRRDFPDTLLAAVLVMAAVIAVAIGVASDARGATIIGNYDLTTFSSNNTISGSPISGILTSVVSGGGATGNFTASGWTWGGVTLWPGSGFTLNGLPITNNGTFSSYSVGLRFSLGQVNGYRKIIDFNNNNDPGQYVFTNQFRFFYSGNLSLSTSSVAPTAIDINETVDFVLTRDPSNQVTAYLNGSPTPIYSFNDALGQAIPSGLLRFFLDDDDSTNEYSPSGTVGLIRIWDAPLSAAEIPTAMVPVPEPATAAILAVAGGGFLLHLHRRRRVMR